MRKYREKKNELDRLDRITTTKTNTKKDDSKLNTKKKKFLNSSLSPPFSFVTTSFLIGISYNE